MQRPDESLPHADRIRALARAREERGVARAVPEDADEGPTDRRRPAGPLPPGLAAHVRGSGGGADGDAPDAPDRADDGTGTGAAEDPTDVAGP
ncbi:hypothetical protein [Patulibacter minatonensis]|uniref:hypothetical protein n=1 Tax=Patulibacter minatonensis TaxID=298163 RepID=UPI00047C257E|nr:hypothetical protein [Patulibacter minatonensis]